MDVTGVSNRAYGVPKLPSAEEMAAVLAARPSMAQLSQRAATEAVTGQDRKVEVAQLAAAATGAGRVDLFL